MSTQKSQGFTIVELAVIVPILVVAVLVLFNSIFFLVRSSSIDQATINITYDAQNALGIIENDAVLTSTFLPTTGPTITDAYKPATNSNQWSYIGDSQTSANRVLILKAYNTSGHPMSTTRQPSFLSALGCDAANIYSNDVLQYNLIYFVSNGNLYRRHALDTTQATCAPIYQKQSCPSLETLGTGSRDISCQADDELVAANVTAFTITYYPSKTSTTPIDVYALGQDPESVTAAAAVDISITIAKQAYGKTVSHTSSLRIAKINAPLGE